MPDNPPPISSLQLETALLAATNTPDSHNNILELLFNSRVYLVLDTPWDGHSPPSTETHMLLVSDGDNLQQTMLALFTSRDKADMFPKGDTLFQYSMEVDARWALLGVPQQAGIMINPNAAPGFRILPKLAAKLRELAQKYLAGQLLPSGGVPGAGSSQ